MTETKTYNGWTNYETWIVKLWMDNEEGSYRYWTETAQECYDGTEADDVWTHEALAIDALEERLKCEHEDAMPELSASVWSDMLNAALSEVNWHEIAASMIEDVDKGE